MNSALDGWGLDAPLYARCILSILKQPPLNVSEGYVGSETESEESAVEEAHGWGRRRLSSNSQSQTKEEPLESALLECLSTAEVAEAERRDFVNSLLRRYRRIQALFLLSKPGHPQGDLSLDSGVCPSPDSPTPDSFPPSYDEAFPPLQDEPKPSIPSLLDVVQTPPQLPPQPLFAGFRPRPKRFRLSSGAQPFTTQWSRPRSTSASLLGQQQAKSLPFGSCPPRGWRIRSVSGGSQQMGLVGVVGVGGGVAEVGGLAQLRKPTSMASFDGGSSAPTFLVPKLLAPTPTSNKILSLGAPPTTPLLPPDILHIIDEDEGPPPVVGEAGWRSLGAFSQALAADLGRETLPVAAEEEQGRGFFFIPRTANIHQQQSASVKDTTKFQPILETPFVPAPCTEAEMEGVGDGVGEGGGEEDWFVLREGKEAVSEAKRRREALPLKFRLGKPAKEVQTEPEESESPWDTPDFAIDWEPSAQDGVQRWLEGLPTPAKARTVSLCGGSSIWNASPRTACPNWSQVEPGVPGTNLPQPEETQADAADDELLLSIVGGISVTAPLH